MQIVSWFDCTYKIYFITVSTWKICTILHNLILLLILSWLIQCKYSIWLILLCKTWEKIQQNVFNHHGLVHKNLAPHPEWIFQHLCHPTKKRTKKINQLTFWQKRKKLTASNSSGVKKNFSIILNGTIKTTKNGKAKAMGESFTAHKIPNPTSCTIVNACIFHVLTWKSKK